jgi:hypothetical protein
MVCASCIMQAHAVPPLRLPPPQVDNGTAILTEVLCKAGCIGVGVISDCVRSGSVRSKVM